jgi:D-glycero-D-manno-heptose 1,7-bisphosphate phosphatase
LACADAPGGAPPYDRASGWRKPAPGMLLAAAEALNLDLAASTIVGDKLSDLEAGDRAGLNAGIHVLTGHGHAERAAVMAHGFKTSRLFAVETLAEVPQRLFAEG